ncbi:hypothetical protein ABS735_26040 [Streptomyces sp. MMCC 100]|uniref:hypothetical protein n=1 Tax=Streptomyces sp. MMCC 100 TaxID=3163555 RepID=UPI0035993B7B
MNSDVPLQWDEQAVHELVLGPGVSSAALWQMSRRYVNRIAFRTVDGRRVMQVGTETPHGGTEWFDPSECEVTSDGLLITPAVKQILKTRSDIPEPSTGAMETETKAAPAPPDRHVPDQIADLIRGMNAAVAAGHVAMARELRRDAERDLSGCEGYALYALRSTLTKTDEWLSVHDRNRRVLFIRLKAAQQNGNALAARDLLKKAKKIFARDLAPNDTEAAILTAAEQLIASKLPEPTPQHRAVHRIAMVSSPLPFPVQQVVPARQQAVPTQAKAEDQQHAREELQERRRAKARARSALGALRATPTHPLPPEEEERLIAELSTAMESAGALLSTRDRRDAEKWIERSSPQERRATDISVSSEREGQGATQPHLPSDLLTRTAEAVRGALTKKARDQKTTSWAELRQQLGSALPHMDIADRVEVLVLVDRKTPADQAPLSSLVALADPIMASHYREILAALGLAAPSDDDDLRDVLEADVEQLYRYWRHR